jgi:hypothetical protein
LIEVKFRVHINDGHLYAEGQGVGIHICDKNWSLLVEDIIETVETYYDMPPETEFKLIMESRIISTGDLKLK